MDICVFWRSGDLRRIDRVCIASMLMTGKRVKLFSYGPVGNLPRGVELHAADDILPERTFLRLDPEYPNLRSHVSMLQFSDLFRIALMRHSQGFWLDTDVFVMRSFTPDPGKPYLAHEGKGRLGVSALYFPAEHPIVDEFQSFLAGNAFLPDWLGFRRRVLRPALYRVLGWEFTLAKAGITIFGNDGISRLARKHEIFDTAAPKNNFYLWTGREVDRVYEPEWRDQLLNCPDAYGIHIHAKSRSNEPPVPGSFFAWADEKVAHLL